MMVTALVPRSRDFWIRQSEAWILSARRLRPAIYKAARRRHLPCCESQTHRFGLSLFQTFSSKFCTKTDSSLTTWQANRTLVTGSRITNASFVQDWFFVAMTGIGETSIYVLSIVCASLGAVLSGPISSHPGGSRTC